MTRDRDQLWTVVIEAHSIGRWAVPARTVELEAASAFAARKAAVIGALADLGAPQSSEFVRSSTQYARATEARAEDWS